MAADSDLRLRKSESKLWYSVRGVRQTCDAKRIFKVCDTFRVLLLWITNMLLDVGSTPRKNYDPELQWSEIHWLIVFGFHQSNFRPLYCHCLYLVKRTRSGTDLDHSSTLQIFILCSVKYHVILVSIRSPQICHISNTGKYVFRGCTLWLKEDAYLNL